MALPLTILIQYRQKEELGLSNLFLVFLSFILGLFCRRWSRFQGFSVSSLHSYILNISLPCLVFVSSKSIQWGWDLYPLILMSWISLSLAFAFFLLLFRLNFLSKNQYLCLCLTAGLGNTSFVGFPLLLAFLGPESLPYGVLVDQPGTFLALSTLGSLIAIKNSNQNKSLTQILKQVLTFPPLIALVLAIGLKSIQVPEMIWSGLSRIGDTLTPLALFSVGYSFEWRSLNKEKIPLTLGLGFKLILFPFLVWMWIKLNGRVWNMSNKVLLLESAMAPMVSSSILAITHGFEEKLANLMLGLGIPISILTVYFWKELFFI